MAGRKEELKVELTAVDKLSKVVDKAAKAVDKLDGEEAEVEVTADTDKAEEAVEDVTKALDKLDGETAEAKITTNDAEAEAEIDAIMARLRDLDSEEVVAVLSAKATKLEAEVKQANALLANIDGADATAIIDAKDQASAKLRAVNSRLNDLQGGFKNVRTEGTQSRSVLANLAGNSAQDIGELGGVVGSLGVGLGQLAEYAVDGNIKMKELAKVAGPMAALAGALAIVQDHAKRVAEVKAWETEEVEAYKKAIEELGRGADAVEQKLREIGNLDFTIGREDLTNFFGNSETWVNADEILGQFGFTVGEVAAVIAGGEESLDAFERRMEDAGISGDLLDATMATLRKQFELYDSTVPNTAGEMAFFAETTDSLNRSLGLLQDPMETLPELWEALIQDAQDGTFEWENAASAVNQLAEATGLSTEAIIERISQEADKAFAEEAAAAEDATAAIGALGDRTRTTIDAFSNADSEADGFISALADVAAEAGEAEDRIDTLVGAMDRVISRLTDETPADKARSAYREVNAAVDDFGEGMRQAAEDGLTLAEAFDVGTPAGRRNQEMLEDAGDAAIANGVAMIQNGASAEEASASVDYFTGVIRDHMLSVEDDDTAVDNLISTYLAVPEDVKTDLKLLGLQQAQYNIETHKARLGSIPRDLHSNVSVSTSGVASASAQLAALARDRFTKIYVTTVGSGLAGRASGGPVAAGVPYTVGETGTELFVPDQDGQIVNASQTAALLGARLTPAGLGSSRGGGVGAGSVTYHQDITVNMPPGARGEDVVSALQKYQRRNGPLPLRVVG